MLDPIFPGFFMIKIAYKHWTFLYLSGLLTQWRYEAAYGNLHFRFHEVWCFWTNCFVQESYIFLTHQVSKQQDFEIKILSWFQCYFLIFCLWGWRQVKFIENLLQLYTHIYFEELPSAAQLFMTQFWFYSFPNCGYFTVLDWTAWDRC